MFPCLKILLGHRNRWTLCNPHEPSCGVRSSGEGREILAISALPFPTLCSRPPFSVSLFLLGIQPLQSRCYDSQKRLCCTYSPPLAAKRLVYASSASDSVSFLTQKFCSTAVLHFTPDFLLLPKLPNSRSCYSAPAPVTLLQSMLFSLKHNKG